MLRRHFVRLLTGTGLAGAAGLLGAAPAAKRHKAAARYPSGDVRAYGLSPGASAADNARALQACLNACAGHTPVLVPALDADYMLAGRITVPAGTRIRLQGGARLRWITTEASGASFLDAATRPGLEVQGDGFELTGPGQLVGPSAGVYTAREVGILCVGPAAGSPFAGFTVRDGIEILNWGSHGIAAQYVRDIRVEGIRVHDCGYAGIQFLSCRDGTIRANEVARITPGTAGNAYGISCTHNSRHYGDDPNALGDPQQTQNPFCRAMLVDANVVQDIPQWTGIDFHGAWDCAATANKVYNCRNGVLLQGSSGDGVDFAGDNNQVIGNTITTRRMNGEPTTITATTRLGISVNGGHRVRHRRITVRNNSIDGYGDSQHTSFALQHTNTIDAAIVDNTVTDWRGYGCYSAYSSGVISGNEFGPVADPAGSACIFVAVGGDLAIRNNRHVPGPGAAAMYGVYINSASDPPYAIEDNDFKAATVRDYAGHGGSVLAPAQRRSSR